MRSPTATTTRPAPASGGSRELFGRDVATFLTFNGTGANVLALTALARPGDAVICSDWAHINVDETGAPERIVGTKLIDLPHPRRQAHAPSRSPIRPTPSATPTTRSRRSCRSPSRPSSARCTPPTRSAAICDAAHRHGMRVHMDGARIANAVAAAGGIGRRAAGDDGRRRRRRDVVRRHQERDARRRGGGVPRSGARARGHYVRKTVTQLPSKMRFVAAQFNALLDDDLWLELAGHSNRMATALHAAACRDPRRRRRAPAGGQQHVSDRSPPPRSSRCRPGASSGTGTDPAIRCAG